MSNGKLLTKREIEEARELCLMRDGAGCRMCEPRLRRLQSLRHLVLDHRDNNARNNPRTGTNWQLLCYSHNHKKNPRGKGRPTRIRTLTDLRTAKPASLEMQRKMEGEPIFFNWLEMEIDEKRGMHIDEVLNSGFMVTGLSQKTLANYLDGYCSELGPFILSSDEMIRRKRRDDDGPDGDNIEPEKSS